MKKTHAINLTGKVFAFKTDNVFVKDKDFCVYKWKAGELCRVLGVMELEQGHPHMILGVGRELFDFEEIPLDNVEQVVNVHRDFSHMFSPEKQSCSVVEFRT